MLHGGMGSASLMRSSSGFDSLAKSDGFMVVYAEEPISVTIAMHGTRVIF